MLGLLLRGGPLMAPIALMSVVVVAVGFERMLGLRRSRVAPRRLANRLSQSVELGDFDPRAVYQMCEARPSVLSRVVTAMLGKSGRPLPEVESAAAEASQREADRLYGGVRTLNLAAAVTPLMGLLGTVWGMISAFFVTANMPAGSNKAQVLAEGIYGALVTTFAGLAVAIPAAVLAHYFEGRILRLMGSIEQLLAELTPCMEPFEGGPRLGLAQLRAGELPLHSSPLDDLPPPSGDAAWSSLDDAHGLAPAPHGPLAHEQQNT